MCSKIIVIYGFIMLFASCMSPEKLLNQPQTERLYFGKYGGFTNIPLEYAVVDGRYIYKIENDKFIPLSRVSASQWKEIQNLMTGAGLPQLQLNEPGNMTYYIRITNMNSDKEIKWTDQTQNPQIWQLFKALNSLIKPIKE